MQLSTKTNEMIHDMKANTVREDAKKKQQEAALQEKNDWEWLTGDVRGLRVLHRILTVCGVFRSGFNPNALTMSFSEGQRNVGLYVWDRLARYVPDVTTEILRMREKDV